jgi:GPH family glycoside/pentoside/hexuronide:cation symporter
MFQKKENKANLNFKSLAHNLKLLLRDIKNITKNNPFMRLCGATFLVFNGFQMVASFSYFIIVFYMYKGSYEVVGTVPALFSIIGAVVTSVLVIPVVTFLANKFGKKCIHYFNCYLNNRIHVKMDWFCRSR